MLLYWIWYALLAEPVAGQKLSLLRHFPTPEDIYHASTSHLRELDGMTSEFLRILKNKDLTQAQKILLQCKDKHIGILTFQDAAYPRRLRNISDPPVVLYYKGQLPLFDNTAVISVVGTRRASAYGMTVAGKLGASISACGGLVASGCAVGIDAMAMEGALRTGAAVVGLMGCGLDVIYPKPNRRLLEAICEKGCLLSEYPPGTPPLRHHFPARNRILSGIANGVLVVEAPQRSGALITARLALEQGRDVFVVPGNIDVDSCEGSNALLRDGAIAVLSGWDILQEYEAFYPGLARKAATSRLTRKDSNALPLVAQSPSFPREQKISEAKKDIKSIDNEENSHYSVINDAALTSDERAVVALLSLEPRPMDEVIAAAALPAGTVQSVLTLLAIKGVVQKHPGGRISLKTIIKPSAEEIHG